MNLTEYASHDALGLAALVRGKQVTAAELAQLSLDAIHQLNPTLNAVIEVFPYQPAADVSEDAPFFGVPFLLKDIGSHDASVKFELGSRLAEGMQAPPWPSELVRRFRTSGVSVLGRTNVPDFGASCSTEPLLHGPTRNPWNVARSPGGSSGGAAAAVASGMVPIAHANDAGGSIRWPASCCGLFGLKPSRNLNPVGPDAGLALHGLACEHIVSKSVRDTAAMLDWTAGPDAGAWCWTPKDPNGYMAVLDRDPRPLRIGVSTRPIFPPTTISPEVLSANADAVSLCEQLGHHLEEADLEFDHEATFEAFATVWACGIAQGVEFIGRTVGRVPTPELLEPHIWAALQHARAVSSSEILEALDAMNVVARAYGRLFEKFDVMLTPTGSMEPFALGRIPALPSANFHEWCRAMAVHAPFLSTANLAGIPAMSVPLGLSPSGLPLGTQFLAPMGAEARLLQLAGQLERARPWTAMIPPVHVSKFVG